MTGLDWLQQTAEARIERQLEFADAMDAKAGILFAYCGALIVGAASLVRSGAEVWMWLSMTTALIGGVAAAVILWPQTYRDSPDVEKLEKHVRTAKERPDDVVEALVDQQILDIAFNEAVLKVKARALKVVTLLSAAGTILLGIEVLQGRGI